MNVYTNILITLIGGMKCLPKWILPRYVKEARDRRKTEGKKEGKEKESSKDGEKCTRKKKRGRRT